jgi:hypothetical protein
MPVQGPQGGRRMRLGENAKKQFFGFRRRAHLIDVK